MSRNDVGSKTKYGDLSSATRNMLSSVQPHSRTADGDDQPASLVDRLKSTPADPLQILGSAVQQPTYQARCVVVCP